MHASYLQSASMTRQRHLSSSQSGCSPCTATWKAQATSAQRTTTHALLRIFVMPDAGIMRA